MSPGFVKESRGRGFHIPDPAPGDGIELIISHYDWRNGEEVYHVTNRAAFIESVGGPGGDLLRLFASIPGEAGEFLLQLYTAHLMGADDPCQ